MEVSSDRDSTGPKGIDAGAVPFEPLGNIEEQGMAGGGRFSSDTVQE